MANTIKLSQVKSRKRIVDLAEVFTDSKQVNAMLNLIEPALSAPDFRVLEPACGTGNFTVEIFKRKLQNIDFDTNTTKNLILAASSIYSVDISKENVDTTTKRCFETYQQWFGSAPSTFTKPKNMDFLIQEIFETNTVHANMLTQNPYVLVLDIDPSTGTLQASMQPLKPSTPTQPVAHTPLAETFFTTINMQPAVPVKLDAVVANPPYQKNTTGHANQASALYHHFVKIANDLKPRFTLMIIPSRWFAGGMGLKEFRKTMLKDPHIKQIFDYPNASECFPDVEIKGGVCIFLKDTKHTGLCSFNTVVNHKIIATENKKLDAFDVLIRMPGAQNVVSKVLKQNHPKLSDRACSLNVFNLATNYTNYKTQPFVNSVKLHHRTGVGYMSKDQIPRGKSLIPLHKVVTAKAAEGKHDTPNKVTAPFKVLDKNTAVTMTYLVCGTFTTRQEALNFKSLLETKFVRFLIWLRKPSQDMTKEKLSFVPDLPLNKNYTDAELYKMFNLTPEEILLIESSIKNF